MARLIRFEDVAFEPDVGIPGFAMAPVLAGDGALVKFWKMRAGWSLDDVGVEQNLHFHKRIFEYSAVLAGDFPHIEYDNHASELRRIRFHAGDLMIRPPCSLHGLHREMSVQQQCLMLYWNTGPGTSLLDSNYNTETTDVTGDARRWRELLNDDCRIAPLADLQGELSRASEPFGVYVLRLRRGESLPAAALMGDVPFFSFLWSGSGLNRAAGGAAPTYVPAWSLLLAQPGPVGGDDVFTADEDACWLQVQRRNAMI